MHVKKYKTQKIVSLCIVLVFTSVFTFSNYYQSAPFEEIPSENIEKNPKQADIVWTYNLTGDPGIVLSGSDWSSWVDSYDWLTGAGTEGNPYEIKNVYFNGEDKRMNLISIINSKAHFRIKDCILINTYNYDYDENQCNAIFLQNVENGRISNVNTSDCMNGIRQENSNYTRITGIFARNNDRSGITVSGGKLNRIRNNTISDRIGVRLIGGTFNNDVEENIITTNINYYNHIGISLSNSNFNNISFNTISDFERNIGIHVGGLGNNISGNTISNCLTGLNLGNSQNNYVSENLIVGGSNGIVTSQSSGNNIIMNTIRDSHFYGIYGVNSNNETIWENTVTNSSEENIYLSNTLGVDLALNQMHGHGLFFDIPYSGFTDINIETSNLVNDKPIYFYFNQSGLGLIDFINAGQIFLYECDTVLIEAQEFDYVSTGITMVNCSNSIISSNEAFNNSRWAFSLIDSNYNQILNNEITGSTIIFEGCDHNKLVGNTISYSMTDGLSLKNCRNNHISGNVVSYNDVGIRLFNINHSLIHDNVVNFNAANGISVKVKDPEWVYIDDDWVEVFYFSFNISLTSNEVNDNQLRGILIDEVESFNIIDNTVMRNVEGIYLNDFESGLISENQVIKNQIGLKLIGGSDAFISNNTVNSNIEYWGHASDQIRGGAGIIISDCSQLEVNDNTVIGNAQGMKISDCSGCVVKTNLISENSDESSIPFFLFPTTPSGNAGMHIVGCFNVNLTGNILNNNGVGLDGSNKCSLFLNQITGFGFELGNSDGNIITGNLITGALIAIDLEHSSRNNITYNIIVAQQCFREKGNCVSNVFEENDCTEVLPDIYFREIISLIGLASILGLNLPLILKKRKQRK